MLKYLKRSVGRGPNRRPPPIRSSELREATRTRLLRVAVPVGLAIAGLVRATLPTDAQDADLVLCMNVDDRGVGDTIIAACSRILAGTARFSAQDFSRIHQRRALGYLATGNADRAITDCDEAVRLDPQNADAYLLRGHAYSDKGDGDRAIVEYNQTIRLDPKRLAAYNNRGFAYWAKHDNDRAIADFNEVIRLDPGYIYAYHYRGMTYLNKNDEALALADFNVAIQINPKYIYSYNIRGMLYTNKGDHDRAIADFNEAIRLNPKYGYAYKHRGYAYSGKGDHERAIADFNEAIRLDPKDFEAYMGRGNAYSAKNDGDRGLADMDAAEKIRDQSTDRRAEEWRLRTVLAPREPITVTVTAIPIPQGELLPTLPPSTAVPGQRRVALVIGNDGYRQIDRLWKARGDADAINATLKTMGFETTLAHDLDNVGFAQVLDRFVASLEPADTALFFFAGHGVEIDHVNYLLPTDMPNIDPRQTQFQRSAYKVRDIVDRIRQRAVRVAIAVIDACRDNPLRAAGQRGSATRGLGRMEAEEGEFLLFSAGPREAALDRLSDSDASPTSVFTRVFVKHLQTPGASLVDIAKRTQSEVRTLARTAQRSHAQFPDYSDRIDGNFTLVPQLQPAVVGTGGPPSADQTEFELARAIGTAAAWDAFLARNPTGFLANTARWEREKLVR